MPRALPQTSPTAGSRAAATASLHLAVLLFAFAGLFGKWIALPATTIVFGRTAIASAALGALLAFGGRWRDGFAWRLAANGALLAVHWVAFFQAIQTASVAIGLLGYASFPLFVLPLEMQFLHRRSRAGEWVCAAVVALGLALLVPAFDLANRTVQGLAWGIVAGFAFALLAVANRSLAAHRAAPEIAFWQNACAALCLAPALAIEPAWPTARDVALLAVLGLACTALAHTLFIRSLRSVSAHAASIVAALEPVYGIALAMLLLGETTNARTLCGAALIVGSTLWTSATTRRA